MAKKDSASRAAPDMSQFVSKKMPKGVRYLDGQQKTTLMGRMRKAFGKVKVRHLESHP